MHARACVAAPCIKLRTSDKVSIQQKNIVLDMEDTPIIGSGRALHRSFSITIASIIFVISSSTVPCVNSHSQYTDSWAVEVRGGRHVANKLAETHGFINVGQVAKYILYYYRC